MSSSKPSNFSNVAAVLSDRGFSWRSLEINEVISNSSFISFDEEWIKFIKVVQAITNLETDAYYNGVSDAIFAWNCFQQVIDPISVHLGPPVVDPHGGHENERSFDLALFEALRESLNGFVDDTVDAENWIVLKNSMIGFGRNIPRITLGFQENYALSRDSISDHGCFVLGTESMESLTPMNASKNSLNNEEAIFWYNDMTATVELKLEKSSCGLFTVQDNFIQKPSFDKAHGPMGQAIMYSMDTWHCLARRGVSVDLVPVVVLAGKQHVKEAGLKKAKSKTQKYKKTSRTTKGKKKPKSKKEQPIEKKTKSIMDLKEKICCLEAHVQIPEYLGKKFIYTIDRVVSFGGRTGLSSQEIRGNEESRDRRVIAIYIKTMRFGLENALAVLAKRHQEVNSALPVSLCCRNLHDSWTSAHLIASPIPREVRQRHLGLEISQGEIFHLKDPTKNMFFESNRFLWFFNSTNDNYPLVDNCLVKVSCAAVHNYYVHPSKCNDALKDLYYKGNGELKTKISDVLLGYYHRDDSSTSVSIMKDLRTEGRAFKMLEHQSFHVEKLFKLWNAFCVLVNSLLLPMADVDVIHFDIRISTQITFNILVYEGEHEIVLCLIDFDSVILTSAASKVHQTNQMDAICWTMPGFEMESAYQYLFWQVLWIAFQWHPSPACLPKGDLQNEPNSQNFVSHLFKDNCDRYVEFRQWLGDRTNTLLKSMSIGSISRENIQTVLNELTDVFKETCTFK